MRRVVLDASVVSKWYIEEEDSDRALGIRDLHAQGRIGLSSPVLILYEFGSVLSKHPSITLEDSKTAFQAFLDLGVELRSLAEAGLLASAFEISRKSNVTFYDASYVALSELHGAEFVTADKKLYDKIKDGFNVLLLRDVEPEALLQSGFRA